MLLPEYSDCTIGIIGMGYVGLPLAVEFGSFYKNKSESIQEYGKVIGYDINKKRIKDLQNGKDQNNDLNEINNLNNKFINFTSDKEDLIEADVFIITVPTPIDDNKRPDLKCLINASELIGDVIKKRRKIKDTVPVIIFESTVYPGVTEEICIPSIERISFMKMNNDFGCGYSPERINPGDKEHNIRNIIKVTSGSNGKVAEWVNYLYKLIVKEGTHMAPSIKVAEAAKIIENTQRDINIALMNELSIICDKLMISTSDVIKAASTKWNFVTYEPGLVGGHCISVDPYYLTYKASQLNYKSKVILAGREINDEMPKWISEKVIMKLNENRKNLAKSKILIMGITFKENCSDIRNSLVAELAQILKSNGAKIKIYDPLASPEQVMKLYSLESNKKELERDNYDITILAVAHKEYREIKIKELRKIIGKQSLIFDLKNIYDKKECEFQL